MEVEEDEDALLAKLFFKKYGRALPEKEKEMEKEKNDVDDINMDLIDLTKDDDEMEADTTSVLVPLPVIVKTESIEVAVTNPIPTLRKTIIIPDKEAPLAAGTSENVVADSNVSEDNPVESVNPIQTPEQTIAESDAAIEEASWKEFTAEFGDTPLDEFDDIVLEPLC
jgi:hypothetical protein